MSDTTNDVSSVLVVGGGIGGLSAATAMAERGLDVHVVEITPGVQVYGVGIVQPSNALRALDAIGVADQCLDAGFAVTGAWGEYCDSEGNLLYEIPGAQLGRFPPVNGVTRPLLHEFLIEAAQRAGARLQYGTTIETVEQGEDSVAVRLTDGTTADYDLVVGADGIDSIVRDIVVGEHLTPTFTGQVVWRMNMPRLWDIDRIVLYMGGRGLAGFTPIGPDLMYLLCTETWPDDSRVPKELLASTYRERLAEFGGLVAKARDQYVTDEREIVYRPLQTVRVPAPWYRGRVVLIGDSAHPITPHLGQGAAQAIEDAVVLAQELTSDRPLARSLERYQERRYERSRLIQENSLQIGEWQQHPTPDADFDGVTQQTLEVAAEPI
jgi:2-polyprenyl-6-methoxyphenol hydroxylase-like FAD-dependent oxidoreductase